MRTAGVTRALVFLVIFIALHSGPLPAQAADSIESLLQRGLFEEEGNHNLEAAKKHYQSIVVEYERQRKLAGTAILHLGQCFEKEGRTNEARVQYERVVREFGSEPDLVRAARGALKPAVETPTPVASSSSTNLSSFVGRMQEMEIQRVTKIINESPDLINASLSGGPTLLQEAVQRDQVMTAVFLLSRKANVNLGTKAMAAPLEIAVNRTNREMVQLMLKNGADITVSSLLWKAVETGNREIVQLLLEKGAKPDAPGPNFVEPLEAAAGKGFLAIAELLIEHGADIDGKPPRSGTPLHAAASAGHATMTEFLIGRGANIEARAAFPSTRPTPRDKTPSPFIGTPLLAAARAHQTAAMDILLWKGANVNATTDELFTAAHLCLEGAAWEEGIKLLLKYKPNLEVHTEDGESPLWLAASYRLPGAIKMLVQAGANPDERVPLTIPLPGGRQKEPNWYWKLLATESTTPLFMIVESTDDNHATARALLESGANPNPKTISGRLPLNTAVERLSLPKVTLLLEYHADVNGQSPDGQTALDLAKTMLAERTKNPATARGEWEQQLGKIIEILKTHGAVEHKARPGAVCVVRNDEPFRSVFLKGSTNDPNRYTVLETLLQMANTLAFPDLAKVKIRNHRRDNTQPPEFNAAAVLAQRDPKLDRLVEWGDVIEIPEAAHPIGALPGPPPDYSTLKGISRATNTDRNIYLIESQRALDNIRLEIQRFQKSNNVANIKETGLAAEERLQGLKNRLQSIQTQRKVLQGKTGEEITTSGLKEFRAVQLLPQSDSVSNYSDNSYAEFKNNLAKALAEKKALEETLLPMHPAMRTIIKQIRDLESAVNVQLELIEKKRVAQIDALLKEEESMTPIIEAVRKEVMTSAHIRDEYTSLKEVETRILTQLEGLHKERASNPAPPDKSVDTSAVGYGYPDEIALGFFACLRREVEIRMRGTTERLVLSPTGAPVLTGSPNRWLFDNFEPRLATALNISKLPLSAGDFKNIRVTRQLPGESKPSIIECNLADNPTGPDNLWLRDGDIVDIR